MDAMSSQQLDKFWMSLVKDRLSNPFDDESSFAAQIVEGGGQLRDDASANESKPSDSQPVPVTSGLIRERKSSLCNIRIAPLNIQKAQSSPLDSAASPNSSKHSKLLYTPPQSSRNDKFKIRSLASPESLSSNFSCQPSLKHSPPCYFQDGPDTPRSVNMSSLSSSNNDKTDRYSIGSLYSTPSLSYSTRIRDSTESKLLEKMRRKHNCVRELYNTEWQFAQDMAVVVRIYMCGSADLGLSVRQIDLLFSNVTQILDVSLSLVAILESQIPTQILQGDGDLLPVDILADRELRVGKAMCLALTGQLYEVYESYIHRSKCQMDLYFEITKAFNNHPQMRNARCSPKKSDSASKLNIDEIKLATWLNRCRQRVSKFTTAWSLDSLLIKPVQRLGKYPLFLRSLMECTDLEHADFHDIERAYNRSKHYLDCVNTRFGAINP